MTQAASRTNMITSSLVRQPHPCRIMPIIWLLHWLSVGFWDQFISFKVNVATGYVIRDFPSSNLPILEMPAVSPPLLMKFLWNRLPVGKNLGVISRNSKSNKHLKTAFIRIVYQYYAMNNME